MSKGTTIRSGTQQGIAYAAYLLQQRPDPVAGGVDVAAISSKQILCGAVGGGDPGSSG